MRVRFKNCVLQQLYKNTIIHDVLTVGDRLHALRSELNMTIWSYEDNSVCYFTYNYHKVYFIMATFKKDLVVLILASIFRIVPDR